MNNCSIEVYYRDACVAIVGLLWQNLC